MQVAGLEGVSAQSPCAAPCDSSTNGVGSWALLAEVITMASTLWGASQLFAEYVRTHTHICIRQTHICTCGHARGKKKNPGGCVHVPAHANSLQTQLFSPFTKPRLVHPPPFHFKGREEVKHIAEHGLGTGPREPRWI